MNGLLMVLATTAIGVDFGWQADNQGRMEYIIQIEPALLTALLNGEEIVSMIHPDVKDVRRFRIRVGTKPLPRISADAKVEDDTVTEVISENLVSHHLKATNFNFSIPSNAVINGIIVRFRRNVTGIGVNDNIFDHQIKLLKAGVVQTENKKLIDDWVITDPSYELISYGNETDKWTETWTPSDINNTGFGVVLSIEGIKAILDPAARIDIIRITVYYTN